MSPRRTTLRTTCGSSHAPGQRTMVTASASPPDRTMASRAPAISGSTISALNRLATIANRRPAADRWPSISCGMSRRYTPSAAGLLGLAPPCAGAPRDRHALDDLDPETFEAGDLPIAPHHEPDPVEPEIGEHLGTQAEVAQRLAGVVARPGEIARGGPLQYEPIERRPEPGPAAVDDVEQDADAGLVDRLDRGEQIRPQHERIGER